MAMNMDAMLRIKADVQGENNIRKLGNSMQGLQGQAKNAALGFNSLKGAVVGFGAAIASSAIVGGLAAVVKKSIDAGDELFNLQAKTGIAASALIGFGNAAKLADVDQAALGKGLTKLSVNLVKAAEGNEGLASAFNRLGVNIKDANGQVVPADKALKQIADRFADMPDGAQKAAAAVALFGKSGADLIPLLNEGAASMEKFTYKVGEDFAARSDLFNDTITEFGIQTQGFALELTDALLPALQSILEVFGDLFNTEQDWTALFDVIKAGVRGVATVLYAMVKLVDAIVKNVSAGFEAISMAVQGDFGGAMEVITGRLADYRKEAQESFAAIGKIWTDAPSPGTGRRTGGRSMALDTGSGASAAAAAARRGASEQERQMERRANLTQQAIDLQEQLRRSVEDTRDAFDVLNASPMQRLELTRDTALLEGKRNLDDLTKSVVALGNEVTQAGGKFDFKPFLDLLNQLGRATAELAEGDYQTGLKELTQQQADAMTALRSESGLLTRDQERQLTIKEKLAQIEREMPDLYAAQKDEIDKLVQASAGLTEQQERNKQIVTGIAESIGSAVKSSLDLVIDGTKNWADSLREIASNLLRSIADQLLQIMVITPIVKAITGAFGFASGGIMTDDGPMPLKTYARGGIANSPQLAMFGEGSMPEAYVPLPDGRRIPVAMQGGGGGNTVVNVAVDAKGTSVQGNAGQGEQLGRVIAQAVQAELVKQRRPGGILATA